MKGRLRLGALFNLMKIQIMDAGNQFPVKATFPPP